jgi:SAM-dependent methyltransferase
VGDSAKLPVDDGTFDVVVSQHTLVNTRDKERVLAGAHRVLTADGCLALYEIVSGEGGPPILPLPWASDPSISFLTTAEGLLDLVAAAKFEVQLSRDMSADSLGWFRRAREERKAEDSQRPTLRLLMGPDAAAKSMNMVRNLEEQRIGVLVIVARRL